jgi:hypothetical protein
MSRHELAKLKEWKARDRRAKKAAKNEARRARKARRRTGVKTPITPSGQTGY